jgi:lysine-N-methylase
MGKTCRFGIVCETLTEALKTNGHNRIHEIMANTQDLLSNSQMKEVLDSMRPNYETQANTFSVLWETKASDKISVYQQTVYQSVAAGLGADPATGQVTSSELVARYERGVKKLPEALKDAPHFLENYILNEMWSECFPFGSTSPLEHYLRLVIRFGSVRFMLAAQCSEGGGPDLSVMIKNVQTFCRRFQHDSQFPVIVNNAFRNLGWSELKKIFVFLKT